MVSWGTKIKIGVREKKLKRGRKKKKENYIKKGGGK